MSGSCPNCGHQTLQPAKVKDYLYCTRCGRGSIPIQQPSSDSMRQAARDFLADMYNEIDPDDCAP